MCEVSKERQWFTDNHSQMSALAHRPSAVVEITVKANFIFKANQSGQKQFAYI